MPLLSKQETTKTRWRLCSSHQVSSLVDLYPDIYSFVPVRQEFVSDHQSGTVLKCRLSLFLLFFSPDGEKVSDYEMKLMDIDSEHLGIPVSFALFSTL